MAADDLRIATHWMERGVLIKDPLSTFIDPSAKIGQGTVIEPFCFIQGKTQIGKNCHIGPMTRLKDARLEDGVTVEQSVVESSRLKRGAVVGPWTRIRPGCVIGEGAHLGNFCEFKNARVGKGVKAGHLSYVGDAILGDEMNLGAGSITANFDGKKKHQTKIGRKAFIGSGTILIAPVSVGDYGVTGAGAVLPKGRHIPKGAWRSEFRRA